LIHQARYLVSQFNDLKGCEGGCMYLPDEIGERPGRWHSCKASRQGCARWPASLIPQTKGAAMSNVIGFPLPDHPITESQIDKLHSAAFRELESGICDCENRAKIAAQIMVSADDGSNRDCGSPPQRNANRVQSERKRKPTV
jgi:hypothetical protein